MATVTERISASIPRERAFDYVADFTTSEEWDPGISRATRIRGDGVDVGTRVRVRFGVGPVTVPLVYEVTRYDRPDRVVLETRGSVHHGKDDIRFLETEDGVEIVWEATFGLRGPGGALDPLLRPGFSSVAGRAAASLQQTLEQRAGSV